MAIFLKQDFLIIVSIGINLLCLLDKVTLSSLVKKINVF
jgi:hypothetical protein